MKSENFIKIAISSPVEITKAVASPIQYQDLNYSADRLLLDSKVGNQSGGTGHSV